MAAARLSIKVEGAPALDSLETRPPGNDQRPKTKPTMANTDDKIPTEVARELRTLAHDLSNSLETIVQATYLITQAGPPEDSRRWVQLIDQATQEAVRINNRLREIMRVHS
jgi:nitrogen-specific signal transduction histidine kinase